MSTRTHAIIDHRVDNYQDTKAAVMLLAQTVPAAAAVEEYWRSVSPERSGTEPGLWRASDLHSEDHVDYLGPGDLLIAFGQKVVRISASVRWSGFLTIEPLRRVHLSAFRSIAKCIRGTRLLLLPDVSDVGYDAVRNGMSLEECIARLQAEYGSPQLSVDNIPPDAFTKAIPGSHLVWFNEAS